MRFLAVFLLAVPAFAESSGYIVLLTDPPAPAIQTAARARNVAAHSSLKSQLAARHIPVTAEVHSVLNALFVTVDSARLSELRALPGVRAVVPEKRFHLSLDRAEQLINVPAAWSAVGGISNAGRGIRIAVIDTGIESTHPAFQDTLAAPAGYPACSIANQPLVPLDCTKFTNGKVIVARSYVPLLSGANAATSRPDDNTPRDHVGHGTAVATAAAGVAAGPSDPITGVAPKAWLGSYKVFGSPGVIGYSSGTAIISALEDALNDHMDIAVLSLGAPALSGALDNCGTQGCDAEAVAVQNAVTMGMVVVVAGGNEGDKGTIVRPTLTTVSTPGLAPNAISVAALTNSHSWSTGLNIGARNFHALLGTGPAPAGGSFTAPLSDAASAGDPQACSSLSPGSLAGTIALVQRGTCTFLDKITNLQNAGAAGAVISNNPGDNSIFSPGGLGGAGIPATFVGADDGQTIRDTLAAAPSTSATILSALQPFDVTTGGQIASFSSRGPALGTGGIKPDVAAVGTDLYLSGQDYDPNGALYSPTGFLVSQGTSFSAPQIAGVAALVKQAHPGIAALAVKSAIVNNAFQDGLSVLAVGAGRANAVAAVATNLTAAPASLSFGILRNGTLPLSIPVQLSNLSSASLALSVAIDRHTNEDSAHLAVDRASITLAANATATLTVSLTGTLPSPGNYEGFVNISGAATILHIPFLYTVGDGVPYNVTPIIGDGDDGTVGQPTAIGYIFLQLTDRYGVPVANAPVRFTVGSGGGSLRNSDPSTDLYGLAAAQVTLGPNPGANTFVATAGGLSTSFTSSARAMPVIGTGGVVDAAGFRPGVAVSPGSYIAIFGNDLAPGTQGETTTNLPVSIAQVSVGFSTPTVSAPGHLHFVTPGQVNVQIPWELAGQSSAQMKVSVEDSSGNLYTVPLAAYSPGMFEIQSGGAPFAAARDEDFVIITPANPAKQGHIVQLYCNGLGPVDNPPASGDPAPATTLVRTTTTPVVTIGGQNAPVQFSGLTPTVVGLYQINVTVPNTGAGVKPVIVTIGGFTSKTENIPVR